MNLRHRIKIQNLGDLLGVDPVTFLLGSEDQASLPRMGHRHAIRHRREFFMEIAVSARRLLADGKGTRGLALDPIHQLRPAPMNLETLEKRSVAVQYFH